MPDDLSRSLGMEGGGFSVWVTNADTGEKKEWILSDVSLQIKSRHVGWIKGRRRQEKFDQIAEGVITQEKCQDDLERLDDLFSMGEYSFGRERWKTCLTTPDGAAKLYQLLLEKHQPEVKDWTLEQVQELVSQNQQGFAAAMADILPKSIGKRPATMMAAESSTPSSK